MSFYSYSLEGTRQIISSLHRVTSFNPAITDQPKMQRVINQDKLLRLLRLTPLILVITGFALILVGNIASLKSCKVAGAVVVVVGGLFSPFFAAWFSRQDKFVENTNWEEHFANRTALSTGCNDQLGPIHHFESKHRRNRRGKK